jgi:hypothetical protein
MSEPSFTHMLVEQHFAVMQERKLAAELHFAHAVQVGPKLAAAWKRAGAVKAAPEADDMPFDAQVPEPVVTTAAPEPAANPDNLRERLGLK